MKTRPATIALLLSVMGMIVTMLLHPTAHDVIHDPAAARVGLAVHTLALITIPLALYGLLVLTQRLSTPFAYIVYAVGAVGTVAAVVSSGFIATDLALRLGEADGMQREMFMAMLRTTGRVNQAFARMHAIATSTAIVLWSFAMPRPLGILGYVIGGVTGILLVFGLRLNVHGAGAIYFAQALWMVAVAVMLWREETRTPVGEG